MRTRILSAWLVGALPLAVSAQTVPAGGTETKGAAQVGGISTIDYVTLRAGNLGTPLRFGHIIAGSERIEVDGRVLASGADYGMDYETGVVYLKQAQRTGQRLTIAYRYDSQGKATGGSNFAGINGFTGLSLAPGMSLVGGLGLAERAADGTVMSANVFGWNNTLNFGGKTTLGGLYLSTDRQKSDNVAGLSMDPSAKLGDASTETGKSQFLIQNFRSALFGGTVAVDYQDISKNFASAGQVRSAGYSDADVARLMKERGLKREGFAVSGMKFGNASLGFTNRKVGEKGDGIEWGGYSFASGGLKVATTSQKVDEKFARFNDLSEADRAQLAKETGLGRNTLSMEFAQKSGKLSFDTTGVEDDKTDRKAVRREARFDSGRIGLTFGDQEVDKDFSRIGSLTAAEQGQWGREIGAKRQWAGLTAALGGASAGKLSYSQLGLSKEGETGGKFAVKDASYAGKTWTLNHVEMGGSGKTVPVSGLQDAEANGFVKRVAGFFGGAATNDSHRASFLSAGDVKRDLTSVSGAFGKGTTLKADQLKFGQGEKGGVAESVAVETAKIKASYRHQDFGKSFTDASRLMEFERAKLGTVAGMERTDISFGVALSKTRNFQFGQTTAKDGKGGLDRTTLAYNDKGLQITAGERKVAAGFASAAGLVDSEKDLLSQFVGFQQRNFSLNYTATPGLRVQAMFQDATNDTTDESRKVQNASVDWKVDKQTSISYVSQNASNKDPLTELFAQSLQRMSVTHSFGVLGTVKFTDERLENDGKNNAAPDVHKQYLAYEAKLNPTTSVKTEQTRTSYDNGDKEDISANTVSTALTKNIGVSVTDVAIDRKGDDKDEKKRNYGFYYDFGKGLRLNYGYAQSIAGADTSASNSTGVESWSFGKTNGTVVPNQVGAVQGADVQGVMVNGGYGENTFNSTGVDRTQSFANVGLSSVKPLKFGGFTDLKFNFGIDTAADYSQFLRENHTAGISGKLGTNAFAFGYRAQLANPTTNPLATEPANAAIQAVDRSFALTTDPNPKNPLVINGSIKIRTLPEDKGYMSRNFTVTARPLPGVEVANQVQTNLEQANPSVLLGSTLLADRGNKWTVNYKSNGDTTLGASWEEKLNDATNASSKLSALNLTLFQKSGNPLKFSCGLDKVDGNVAKRQVTRYSLQYDGRVTATQSFSMLLSNAAYAYTMTDDLKGDNWTVRMNYQIRF